MGSTKKTGLIIVQYLAVVSLGAVNITGCAGQEIGPRNITRMEGETDVFIPCPFSGQHLPVWEINSRVYELFQIGEDDRLQQQFIPASRGLLIPRVTLSLNGYSFRCLYPTGVGFKYHESSLGSLIVTPQEFHFTQAPPITAIMRYIYIDHQHTLFQKAGVQLSLKSSENSNGCSHTEMISRQQCNDDNQTINSWPVVNTSVSISSMDLVENETNLVFFNISSRDNQANLCAKMKYNFQVRKNIVTKPIKLSQTREGQIKVPVAVQGSTYIVLPRQNTSDCLCAIILNDNPCIDFRSRYSCGCYDGTAFLSSLRLCATKGGLLMNIENTTYIANGTRIFFYNDYSCDTHPYRTYIGSYEISKVLPEPPKILSVSPETGEVCTDILTQNETITMVDDYDITVQDITGETKFYESFHLSNSTDNCTHVGNIFEQGECAPYVVNVSVHNDFGSTFTNVTVLGNSTQIDTNEKVCSCLKNNVHISATNGQISGVLSAEVYCLKITYDKPVHLKAMVDADNVKNFSCFTADASTPVSVNFGQICGQPFNLSIYWSAPNEIALGDECELLDNPVTIACHGITRNEMEIIIGCISAAVFILIILVLIISTIIYCIRKKRRSINVQGRNKKSYDSIGATSDTQPQIQED